MTGHTCRCTEALNDHLALKAAYWSTCSAYTAACHERDQARDTAARLQAAYDDTVRAYDDTVLAYGLAIRAYGLASRVGDRLTDKLAAAVAERDRARDTAARLEAELAHGRPDGRHRDVPALQAVLATARHADDDRDDHPGASQRHNHRR